MVDVKNVKKVIGFKIGDFQADNGKNYHYINLFTVAPADGVSGLMGDKYKVDNEDVLAGLELNSFVELYFNDKQKVVLIMPIAPNDITDDILIAFGEKSADDINSMVE